MLYKKKHKLFVLDKFVKWRSNSIPPLTEGINKHHVEKELLVSCLSHLEWE